MNSVNLQGNIASDIELKAVGGDHTLARVLVAVDRPGKDKGRDFVRVTLWDETAKNVERFLHQGLQGLGRGTDPRQLVRGEGRQGQPGHGGGPEPRHLPGQQGGVTMDKKGEGLLIGIVVLFLILDFAVTLRSGRWPAVHSAR